MVKCIRWNSLDSSSKFYEECDRAENGQLKADRGETGEISAEYEYVAGTDIVNSVKLPDGSKFAYGRNPKNFEVTSITHSTADGEANTTEIEYHCGLPEKVKSGETEIIYNYDTAGRKIAVLVNGVRQYSAKYALKTVYDTESETVSYGYYTETYHDTDGDITFKTEKSGRIDEDTGAYKVTERTYANKELVREISRNGYQEISSVRNGNLVSSYYRDLDNVLTDVETYLNGALQLTESFVYNDYGEVTQKAITIGEATQTYTYAYKDNAARELESISVEGYTFKPLSDVNGRNTGREIYSGENKVAAEYITYRKVGDHATNMPATVWFGSGEKVTDSIKYKYDSCGNICEIRENGHVVAKYTYDSLNRLVREDNKLAGSTTVITYDRNGNITERCEYPYTLKSGEELEELKCTHYSYDYEGDKLKEYNGEEFVYNNLGCPTTYRGKPATWIYGKLLASYNGVQFTYNGLGSRASKGGITFTYDSDGRLIKQSNGLEFIYDNSGVAGVIYANETYFYRKDAQGNIVAILNANGTVVVKYVYDAWGNNIALNANGAEITSGIGVLNPFRYRGYYYDTETELYYLQTRYYDPELGRFISQDSVDYADPETINGLNLYAYCGNNPVMNVDPTGELLFSFLIGLAIAAAIGATVGAVSYVASEVISYAATGEWTWSWGMFSGAILGGAIGGALSFALPGLGIIGSAAVTGGLSMAIGMGMENALGEANYSFKDIFACSVVAASLSGVLAGITSMIKIPGFTGRGSVSQVARQINTKLLNGSIRNIAVKTVAKIFAYNAAYSVFNTVANGFIEIIQYYILLKKRTLPASFPTVN